MAKQILVINVGDENWEPTTEDLENLTKLFLAAHKEGEDLTMVAVPHNVTTKILNVSECEGLAIVPFKKE